VSTPPITWVGMTRQHYESGRPGPIRALVVHATAGEGPGDLAWLRKGGNPARPVSCHYYIDKAGRISQLVRDEDTAWHAGVSRWTIDGRLVEGLNTCALGIELENRNDGKDSYPAAQVYSLVRLSRALVSRYGIPRPHFVRHLEISPGRKTDPAGLDWHAVVAQVYPAYTAESPILGAPGATLAHAIRYVLARPHGGYSAWDVAQVILPAYFEQCSELGIDPIVAIAQMIHETGNLCSALSQRRDRDGRDLRNPAGIGVWERKELATPHYRPGTVYDADVGGYRPACQFKDWTREAIPAHLGRLLAYALPLEVETTLAQEAAIRYAIRVRPFPDYGRGTAPTLRPLGKKHNPAGARGIGWASPGDAYGEALARVANAIRSTPL
jgi:hypothetical protein